MTQLETYSAQFKVFDGNLDVTTGYSTRYYVVNQNNCAVNIDLLTGVYTVSDVTDDNANAIFVAKYQGVSVYKTFSIAKSRETDGPGTAKRIVLNTNNYAFSYDEHNQPATATAILNVDKFNTAAPTVWKIRKLDDLLIAEGTAADLVAAGFFTSTANPDQVTLSQTVFNSLITSHSTNAVVIEAVVVDGLTTFSDRVTLFQLIQKNKVTWEGISDPTGAKAQVIAQSKDAMFIAGLLERTVDDITARQIQTASSLHVNIDRVSRGIDAKFLVEQTAREELSVELEGVNADLQNEKTVRAGLTDALAFDILDLNATVGDVQADLTTESSTRASADSALSSQYTGLHTTTLGLTADLATEITARTTADSALTSQYTTLSTSVTGLSSNLSTETTARISADGALAADITTLNSTVGSVQSSLTTEIATRTSADSALSSAQSALSARLNNYNGTGSSIEATTTATHSALATEVSARAAQGVSLAADYNGKFATVNSTMSATVSALGVVENRWTLSLNGSGTSFAGMVVANGSNSKAYVAFQADATYFFDNSGSGTAPFYVSGGQTYIQNATIPNASITSAKIGTGEIKFANIGTAEVGTLSIAGNAVTIPLNAYTGSDQSLSSGSPASVQSLTISSSGAPIQVQSYVVLYKSGTLTSAGCTVELRRDGSTIYSFNTQIFTFYENPIIFTFSDTPGAGSHTYEIWCNVGTSGFVARKRFIGLLETKR